MPGPPGIPTSTTPEELDLETIIGIIILVLDIIAIVGVVQSTRPVVNKLLWILLILLLPLLGMIIYFVVGRKAAT